MRFAGEAYRAHDPRWSFTPLSGEGASIRGGRFNEVGVAALYLSLSLETAVAEAMQGFAERLEPLTLCLYEIDCEDIVDLRTETLALAAGATSATLRAPWMEDRLAGREPVSWRFARRVRSAGAAGLLVPSFAPEAPPNAVNLVLWRWGQERPHRVTIHDPAGRLPVDQKSWHPDA